MNTFDYLEASHQQETKYPIKLAYSRDELATWFYQAGFMRGAEIGVERGYYSEILCTHNPNLVLYCIDPWYAYNGYREHVSKAQYETIYGEAIRRLNPYDTKIMRMTSRAAADYFEKASLDFVYLDANHEFSHIAHDICLWEPKVKRGGIIAGHDFTRRKKNGYINHVKDVVQAYTYSHDIKPWYILTGDKSPSWFWRKK